MKFYRILPDRLPTIEDLDSFKSYLRERLSGSANVEWAVLCGSAITGKWRPVSDIDLVVCVSNEYIKQQLGTARCSLAAIRQEAIRLGLPLDLTTIVAGGLPISSHSLRPGFLGHVKSCATSEAGRIYRSPRVPKADDDGSSPFYEAARYVGGKIDKAIDQLSGPRTGHEWDDVLQDSLTCPPHVIRMLFELFGRPAGSIATQFEVFELSEQSFRDAWDALQSLRTHYADTATNATESEWQSVVRMIEYAVPTYLDFLIGAQSWLVGRARELGDIRV